MKIAISAESTIDMPKDLLNKFDIKTTAFHVLLGDSEFADGEISIEEIIEFVNKNKKLPKTSAVNEEQFKKHFSSLLKEYDAVIHFSLSSKISSACDNAIKASKEFSNVFVVDTLSLSTGIALLAIYARDLANQNLTPETIYNKCLKRVPFVQASFVLSRVDYLYKGGRCSALALLGANILKIRPEIAVINGSMSSVKKYRGVYEKVFNNYLENILNQYPSPDFSNVFITYTTASDDMINNAVRNLKLRGFKKIYITRAGATITSHCGENCIGILYINDGDSNKNE